VEFSLKSKRFIPAAFVLSVAFVLGAAGFAYAAGSPLPDGSRETGSTAQPMHRADHIGGALHREMVTVFILPEMQSELGLAPQQVAQLRGLKQDLLAKSKDIAGQTATRRKELDTLLSGDTSRTRAVKALFEKIADLRAQMQYTGFETANKMKGLLNDSQKAKFQSIKPEDLHRLMMSRANMGDMEQAMQLMAAGEGMGMPGREMGVN
jgi:Spy/CpxP family protein refolding chaperone